MIDIAILDTPLSVDAACSTASNASNGAIALFVGTVRATSGVKEGEVVRLEYEAYVPMAEGELRAIAEEAAERFGATSVVAHHRVGNLSVGEPAVIIAVGTPHRAEAFDACRYVIEELKKRVPIWKKEVFEDGAAWVNPRP